MEGHLKAEIATAPERYVVQDPEAALALLDQKAAGKKLLLITNSEWSFTSKMMSHAYDRHLPEGMTWRQLFDVVIVAARKPAFFVEQGPFFEVVDEAGLLRPLVGPLKAGGIYLGRFGAPGGAGPGHRRGRAALRGRPHVRRCPRRAAPPSAGARPWCCGSWRPRWPRWRATAPPSCASWP